MIEQEDKNNDRQKSKIALMEEAVIDWWDKNDTFRKSLRARKNGNPFIFYEGPPTANGMPHPGHIMGRCFKDIFLRYKSMRGYFVPRNAGWDTHGLPVEIEIEKQLGIKSKPEIEKFGVAEFNRLCKQSVWKYKDEWEKLTKRIGFWLDMEHPYITYENKYIETLWWIIGQIFKKGLLVQDYKVMHYCVRCGTGLSSHEIAQEYKVVQDKSVYVKFRLKSEASSEKKILKKMRSGFKFDEPDIHEAKEYFLVWTTTPWTLPANVALAVNPKLTYARAKKDKEILILAKDLLKALGDGWEVIEEFQGKELLGEEYHQLFEFLKPEKKAFFVAAGDFVSAQDGTGIVHIAPAYGEDDMQIAREYDLPILHPVMENGQFEAAIPWQGKFVKNADPEITEDLKNRGLLFKEEIYEHEYPFCWRCHTPILYYARKSWFIRMSKLKQKVIANNKQINWVPAHLKEGRFGEWLLELKDWAFSRDRYWGTPLPIWQCGKCGDTQAVSSIAELSRLSRLKNRYFIMRHGRAVSNEKGFADLSHADNHVTENGLKDMASALKNFKKKFQNLKPDLIISSPVLRARETADIASDFFGIARSDILTDPALSEINVGIFDGKSIEEYHRYFASPEERFIKAPPDGENLNDVRKRVTKFIEKEELKYGGKNILIISHEISLWILETALDGLDNSEILERKLSKKGDYIDTGEIREIVSGNLPLNTEGKLDLHKPYIDDIKIGCKKCGAEMDRAPEVTDVWFDSGAMPFAQGHWPFAQMKNEKLKMQNYGAEFNSADYKKLIRQIPFPADFICEGVDQTRGWFYTMLAVSTLLETGAPYKNVISTGHILDKSGKKMSKSKKNYVDPIEIADKYGIDSLRWYFFTVNSVGEPKRFDEKDVSDAQRKSVMLLLNIYNFFESYASFSKKEAVLPQQQSLALLDRWVLSRLHETAAVMNIALDEYDAMTASRSLASFLDDFSTWYLRRSRSRFQHPKNKADLNAASAVFQHVFENALKLAAPIMPFVTEHIWLKFHNQSIHLENYPQSGKKYIDKKLGYDMIKVREIAAIALKKRAEAGVKVRQPLAALKFKIQNSKFKIKEELSDLIKEEINVKEVISDNKLEDDVWLDANITPELKEEGIVRDVVRNIQQLRKETGLTSKNIISIKYFAEAEADKVMIKFRKQINKQTLAKDMTAVKREDLTKPKEIDLDGAKIWIEITRHES